MANSDAELEILIRTAADTYGIENAQNALLKYKNVLNESGGEAEHHNEHHREMRKLFLEMNRILPESGHLLHGLFAGPEVLAILATVAALSKVVETIKEHRKQLEELAKVQTDMMVKAWTSQVDEARNARGEYEKFNIEIQSMVKNFDHLKQSQDEAKAVLDVYNKALEESAGKDEQKKKSLHDRSEAMKQIQLEAIAKQDQEAVQDAQDRLEEAHEARLKGAPGAKAASMTQASAEYDKAQFAKAYDEFRKLDAMRASGAELMTTPERISRGVPVHFEEELEKAARAVENANNKYVASAAAVDAHTRKVEELKRAESEAEDEVRRRTSQLMEARSAAGQGRAILGAGIEASDEAALSAAGVPNGALRAPIGRSIMRSIEAFEKRGGGEKISSDALKMIDGLVMAMHNAGRTNDQINALIKEMIDMHTDQSKKIQDLWNAMKTTRYQIKSTLNQTP